MFNKKSVYKKTDKKRLVHSNKGWLVCGTALLAMLGLGGYQVSHAESVKAPQDSADQQSNTEPQSINITHNNADAQQGFGNVDQDSAEMKTDLNNRVSNQQTVKPTDPVTKPSARQINSSNNTQGTSTPAEQNADSARQAQPDTSAIQQHANAMHAHLMNEQATQPVQKHILKDSNNVTDTVDVHYMLNGEDVEDQPIHVSGQVGQNADITSQLDIPDKLQRTSNSPVSTKLSNPLPKGWLPIDPKTGFTAQPAGSTDKAPANSGWHAYLSADGKTLTVTGNMKKYLFSGAEGDNAYGGLDLNDNSSFQNVTTLNLGNMTNFTDADNLFNNMSNLQTLNQVGNFDTSHVTNMGSMFKGDSKLTNIGALSDWNTTNVTDMYGMFEQGGIFTTINPLLNWNTNNVTTMNNMFSEVISDSTPIPGWHINSDGTPNVTENGGTGGVRQSGNPSAWNIGSVKLSTDVDVPVEAKQPAEAAPIVFSYSNQNGQVVGFTKPITNLGKVGQTVNVEPELAQYLPQGYHLSSTQPVNITLNNDSYINVNV